MIKRFLNDIKKYYRFSVVSAKSQLKSEVAGSYLNWIWWVLDPLCFMLIYTFIFGYVFNSKEQYFPVYIFIGLTMWDFFNKNLQGSVKLIKNSKSIVSKVYFPKYVLLMTKMWVNLFKMMVSFGIVVIMMLLFRIPISWNILFCLPILLILMLFTFGCSCFLMHYGVYVQDLANVLVIVLRMVFYLTGIFYNVEKRIPQWGPALNRYNPVAFLITGMRKSLIYGETPEWTFLLLWLGVSLLLVVLGIRKIYKEENSYVKSI
ncbi:MAG: ABC transporter permease [Oscillospiraceae bacterium]|nr:ABC transporter permease [Oscillospiraceae bacterium]